MTRSRINPGLIGLLLPLLCACSAQPMVYQGFYTWGPEVDHFNPCGSDKIYWVVTSDALNNQLVDAHEAGRTEPYQGLFVEVRGHYAGPPDEERGGAFADQTDGLFQVTEVRAMRRIMPSDCK